MVASVIDIGRWQEFLRQVLPGQLFTSFAGGSRRELLKNVDAVMLIFDDQIVDLTTGRQLSLPATTRHSADSLAEAVSELLDLETSDTSVILLLPPDEFVATTVDMPGMARDSLVSALQLQADSLLPSHSESLLVAVSPHAGDEVDTDIALWITERRLDELYQAFEQQSLFLAGVVPRCLALAGDAADLEIQEEDQRFHTSVTIRNGVVHQWLMVDKKDLQQEIFLRQWRQALPAAESDELLEVDSLVAADTYMTIDTDQLGNPHYCFMPGAALQAKKQVEKGKRAILGLAALAVVALLASLPFLAQEVEMRRLQANLRDQQELSLSAREDRGVVQNFEQQWGVLTNFPEQDLVQTLFTLQSVLSPEQLTSLELNQGVIRIEGESAEPQAILQRLEQHPRFTEVTFSRATSNTRYYIDLRLSTVNFEGYMVRYFLDN